MCRTGIQDGGEIRATTLKLLSEPSLPLSVTWEVQGPVTPVEDCDAFVKQLLIVLVFRVCFCVLAFTRASSSADRRLFALIVDAKVLLSKLISKLAVGRFRFLVFRCDLFNYIA